MAPEDDDWPDEGGGPPPDPSVREWRHPSEVAAAAAAAARPVGDPGGRRAARPSGSGGRQVLITIAGSGLGLLALAGLSLAVFGSSMIDLTSSGAELQASEPQAASLRSLAPADDLTDGSAGGGQPDADASEAGLGPNPTRAHGGDGRPSPDQLSPEDVPATSAQPSLTSTTLVSTTSEAIAASTEEASLPEFPDGVDLIDGIYTLAVTGAVHVAGYIAIEDTVFSAGSRVDRYHRLALRRDGAWVELTLLGVDPITDIAVLLPADGSSLGIDLWVTAVDGGSGIASVPALPPPDELSTAGVQPSSSMHVGQPVSLRPGPAAADGSVIGLREPTVLTDGRVVHGTVQTSITQIDDIAGNAILSPAGELLGLVIESSGSVVSAVPYTAMIAIGESYRTHGTPSIEWIGIKGTNRQGGGVTVNSVTENSPVSASGLLPGDAILALNGTAVDTMAHLMFLVREAGVGTDVVLDVEADGQAHELVVTIGSVAGGSAGP